ncbi:MAG: serine/threonine protein phosphatase [Firmicutes bacterium]|nr:serine/threonine protein phosphatase [Bacillota bacterium]
MSISEKQNPKDGRRFAVSDIHGCFHAFERMLEKIDLQPEDTLYILGDMIDRGPNSRKVIEWIRRSPNMIPLMGNHEWMLLQYLDKGPYKRSWNRNGNQEMRRWLDESKNKRTGLEEEAMALVDWVRALPYWIELDDYLLIHAGWNQHLAADQIQSYDSLAAMLEDQNRMDLVWAREEFFPYPCGETIEALTGRKKTVIFGHTPTVLLSDFGKDPRVWHDPSGDKINIDCGAFYGGKLACLDLDTLEEYYTEET